METDRASLSEEYELLRAAGATDACYSLLYRCTPSIIRIFQQVGLLRLKWVKKKKGGGHLPFSAIRQTDTNYHSCFFHQRSK